MFDLYNTLESYGIMGGGKLEPSYEGIIDKVKNAGSTIWGILKKIWEGIKNKLGELGRKIKKAWEFAKNFIKNRGNKSIEEDEYEEEPYPEEDYEDDDYFKNDEDDSSNPTSSNKFAKGRGKNITRRRLKNEKSAEPDSNTTKDKISEPSKPEKTSHYKSPKIKNASRELDKDMKMLLKIVTQINRETKYYDEALSILNAEAKTGNKVGDGHDIKQKTDSFMNEIAIYDETIDSELSKFEDKIASRGVIKLTSNLPGVEKYYQVVYTTIMRLQQSTGDILKHVDKKVNTLKHKYGQYEFNRDNSNGTDMIYSRHRTNSGKTIANSILMSTKSLSSFYNRIINITSKMILSPSK